MNLRFAWHKWWETKNMLMVRTLLILISYNIFNRIKKISPWRVNWYNKPINIPLAIPVYKLQYTDPEKKYLCLVPAMFNGNHRSSGFSFLKRTCTQMPHTYYTRVHDTLALFLSPSSLICDKCLFHSVIFIYYDYGR